MTKVSIIGVDLVKNVFQLHGAAPDRTVLFRKKLTGLQFHRFMAEQPACLVAMEACGGAHYWARGMRQLGHDVRLIAPRYVRPFVKRRKNDAADAVRLSTRRCADHPFRRATAMLQDRDETARAQRNELRRVSRSAATL